MAKETFDVIVVGAGPGGLAAAKKCAENGMKTLILEKRKLPREKVCSGMLFGAQAKALVEEEFGGLPEEIVIERLSGFVLWVPEAGKHKVAADIPITWRKDLDYWLSRKAVEAGAEIREQTRVERVTTNSRGCSVKVAESGVERELEATYLVGADGCRSTTRRSLFPELKVRYSMAFRECYRGSLDLERGYCYIVFPNLQYRPNFWINPKGDCFTLEGATRELKDSVRTILCPYGFGERELLWKDGCPGRALLFEQLVSGNFTPAMQNCLLVGDAAGIKFPISGEGINTAIKSGLVAAASIIKAAATGQAACGIYLKELSSLVTTLNAFHTQLDRIASEIPKGPEAFLDALSDAFTESMEKFIQ